MPTPIPAFTKAIDAYNTAAKGGVSGLESRDVAPDGQFADLVKSALEKAVEIGERSERITVAGINDRADLNQVVTAVAEAELTLKTVVAVRDKVIESYKQIIRMPM